METPVEEKPRPVSPLKAPRKRKRIVISCTECHRRKQKCDRAFPCSNCVARNKQSLCRYENESARKQQLLEESRNAPSHDGLSYDTKPIESETVAQVHAFGYAKSNGNNNTTLGIFKKIENHESGTSSLIPAPASNGAENSGLQGKYKNLIRQLPSKPYIEKLIVTYFREVNYQYYPLDEGIFRDLLKRWESLSFSTLNRGPSELPADLQFFPGLLFQCLALALQFQPPEYDPTLDSLKYAAAMSFDDLASDYSESGTQILCLLGKRHTTLVTVQAGFLRTAYLKNCGMIPESWHCLGQTIRDAQEIGLHKENHGYRQRIPDEKPEDVLENLWLDQLRRRMWVILALWDIHMAIVLGRPTTVDCRDGKPVFPIDSPIPKNRQEVAPALRTEDDPPTPLTMLLWTAELAAPLWDISNLERDDPNQNDFSKVELMHKMIKQIHMHCPPPFRAHNPDTTFDSHPDCYWLPRSRPLFQSGAAFTIMALHRPYIFTNSSSRTEALRAALDILRAQKSFFNMITNIHYKMHALVLNTFDAIVLVAAIYILHPSENKDDLDDALQHFEWAMERLQTIGSRNVMANGALGVLKAIYVRLKKALSRSKIAEVQVASVPASSQSPALTTPDSSTPTYPPSGHPSISSASTNSSTTLNNTTSQYTLPTISNLTKTTPPASEWEAFSGAVPMPSYDFSSMAPLQPMHDLLFNDLGTVDGGLNIGLNGSDLQNGSTAWAPGAGDSAQWQFEGDFGNDSFWGFMNNYQP